ncbi:MAG TPA: RNA polymerase sigma factor [Candidatus Tidjanibacter gallistercoris]|nr:RNA polymerase sigma factor [Candidatus Tidjanibacter gallistercoris]
MDQAEFSARLIPMKDKIYRFARAILSDVSEAEDVTQDIFERLWAQRSSLERYTNLDAFVMVSVRNLCYDRLRSRKSKRAKLDMLRDELPRSTRGFADEETDTRELLLAVMAELPEKQRTVMHLRDVEDYEIDRIAEIIGMESPTVRVLLSRARRTVKEKFKAIMDYGIG